MLTLPLLTAWIPFVAPIPSLGALWWLLVLPLVFATSMVWKAVRLSTLERYWSAVLVMVVQVLFGMAGLALGLLVLVRFVVPLLPV